MIHIRKNDVPVFMIDYIKKNPKADYDSDSFKPYYHTLRERLIKEQKGLCAYCCSQINIDNSHNEHIEPRHMRDGSKSNRSLDYYNIVASCNTTSTCGNHKGNEYDEKKFISPLDEDCDNCFSYDPDGYMCGDEYTIGLLNLNSYELRMARKAVYKTILCMSAENIRLCFCSDSEQYMPHSDVIFWFLKWLEETEKD